MVTAVLFVSAIITACEAESEGSKFILGDKHTVGM